MQSEAYKLTGFTAVVSAAGFLLRWLQDMQILDTETGLAEPGRPMSYIVAGLILLMALGFGALVCLWLTLRFAFLPLFLLPALFALYASLLLEPVFRRYESPEE